MIALLLALTFFCFVGSVTFIGLYLRSRWWVSQLGRNLMAKAVVLAGMFGLSLAGYFTRVPMPVWAGGLGLLGAIIWWRVAILWRIQHRHDARRMDPEDDRAAGR